MDSISKDERSYNGPQAVAVFQAKVLRSSLGLYLATDGRVIPTRGVGIKAMMRLASQITGKPFAASRKQIPDAIASLELLIEASVFALKEE